MNKSMWLWFFGTYLIQVKTGAVRFEYYTALVKVCFVVVVLGFGPKDSYMPGTCSTTELCAHPVVMFI